MQVLVILGTARSGSQSRNAAEKLCEKLENKGLRYSFYDIAEKEIPPLGNRTYKQDEKPVPEDITELKTKIEASSLVIIVTPEYNHSIPGILKTTLDYMWPEYSSKPFAFIGVSAGADGPARALTDLRKIMQILGAITGPELLINNIKQEKFDQRIEKFVEASIQFAESPVEKRKLYIE